MPRGPKTWDSTPISTSTRRRDSGSQFLKKNSRFWLLFTFLPLPAANCEMYHRGRFSRFVSEQTKYFLHFFSFPVHCQIRRRELTVQPQLLFRCCNHKSSHQMKVDSKKKLNDDDEWESLGGGGGRGPRLMFFLFALLSLSACAPVPLWYATGGPLHDLRRASADGEMQEQVLVASLVAPGSPAPVRWLAVEKEVAFWTDQTGWSGVRRFDVANALPGQRMSTLLEDRTGALPLSSCARYLALLILTFPPSRSVVLWRNCSE